MLKKVYDQYGVLGATASLVVPTLILALVGLLIFRVFFVTFIDNYEMGYIYDAGNGGSITILDHTGYVVTTPFLRSVHTIDLRPMQVCMNANARVLNCKLVKFNPAGFDTFIAWHGRGDYDGGNCTQMTDSHVTCGKLNEILKSYAFDDKQDYPFFTFEKAQSDGNGVK